MKIQTFSIVVGTRACNASCPFCVSRMTGFGEIPKRGAIEEVNFKTAARLAQIAGTTTVLMTGKGEPTLYPEEVTEYLTLLNPWGFPLVEIQTNALEIGRLARDGKSRIRGFNGDTLLAWRKMGLKTIAISVISEQAEHNRKIYHEDYPDLGTTIAFLKRFGYTVRLCVMMQKGAVDTPERLLEVLAFCKEHHVDQCTARPIRKPSQTADTDASRHVTEFGLDDAAVTAIREAIAKRGKPLLFLSHGAVVYDVGGQNLCLSDCLTVNKKEDGDTIRTLIFYGDGQITYDWQYEGAVILGPGRVTSPAPSA